MAHAIYNAFLNLDHYRQLSTEHCLHVHFGPLLLLSICSSVRCYSAPEEACEAHPVSTLHIKRSVVPSGVVLHPNKLVEVMYPLVLLGDALHLKGLV